MDKTDSAKGIMVGISKKKIVILADWYEPGYKAGGPIQSVGNFVAAMHKLFDISVITTDTDLGESVAYPDIISNRWMNREPGLRVYYANRSTLTATLLKTLITTERPDFIYINSLYSVRLSILPLFLYWRQKIQAILVLSPRGMLRESAISIKTTRKKIYLKLLNWLGLPKHIRFHATDELEKTDIRKYFPKAQSVNLIPNFSASLPSEIKKIAKSPGSLRCVYISRIMGIKNIIFFLEVLKQVPANIGLEFTIYGDVEDENYWQEAQKIITFLPPNVRVSYLGSLPHAKVIAALGASHVFVLPTKGENFGHAIFESFSAGRPVLISNKTPWLDLKEKSIGWDLTLGNSQPWIQALEEVAAFDQETFDQWSDNCRKYAETHVGQSDQKSAYIELFSR